MLKVKIHTYFVSFIGDAPKKNLKSLSMRYESCSKNDQEAYEMGVSKAFKPIMENTLKYLNVGKSSDTSSKLTIVKCLTCKEMKFKKQR